MCGAKSVLRCVSSLSSKNSAQWRAVSDYIYPARKLTIWEIWPPEMLPFGEGGMVGTGGVGSGVGSPRRTGECASVSLRLQRDCSLLVVTFWQGRQPDVWFWRSIAEYLCIAAFPYSYPKNSTPHVFSSWTSAGGFLMRYFVVSVAAHENPSLAIVAIFNARCMSDCSSCTRPPCLAIVTEMLRTYKTLVGASNNEIRRLPPPYTLP